MPDEKIDRKRPAHAENEPKSLQQRHVDDTVDDSFPASDPPAWTTSASKSVAAECEPDDLKDAPIPPGEGLETEAGDTARSRADQVSGLARDLYRRGQSYVEQGRRHWPEAERYYRQRTEAMRRPVQDHPLATVIAVGALGCALGWLIGRRTAGSAPVRQWLPGSNRRPTSRGNGRAQQFEAHDEAEAASHTSNSF